MSNTGMSEAVARIIKIINVIGYKVVSTNSENRSWQTYINEEDHAWLLVNGYTFHLRQQNQNGSYEYIVLPPKVNI